MRNGVFCSPSAFAELLEELFQVAGTAVPGEVSNIKSQKEQQGLRRHPHSEAFALGAARLCGALTGVQPPAEREHLCARMCSWTRHGTETLGSFLWCPGRG